MCTLVIYILDDDVYRVSGPTVLTIMSALFSFIELNILPYRHNTFVDYLFLVI